MSIDFIMKALQEIKQKPKDRGSIICPECGGKLNYSRAKSNGHVWGKCETPNCLSWMM